MMYRALLTVLLLLLPISAEPYEVATHEELVRAATRRSSVDQMLKDELGLQDGIRNAIRGKVLETWLVEGGANEDNFPRFLNHFHNSQRPGRRRDSGARSASPPSCGLRIRVNRPRAGPGRTHVSPTSTLSRRRRVRTGTRALPPRSRLWDGRCTWYRMQRPRLMPATIRTCSSTMKLRSTGCGYARQAPSSAGGTARLTRREYPTRDGAPWTAIRSLRSR